MICFLKKTKHTQVVSIVFKFFIVVPTSNKKSTYTLDFALTDSDCVRIFLRQDVIQVFTFLENNEKNCLKFKLLLVENSVILFCKTFTKNKN